MPNLKTHPSIKLALTRHNTAPSRATRTLQSANKEALDALSQPEFSALDPKGRVLRQLRVQAGIDPSELATQACMSLAQLYELERGEGSRFYSDSLRRQAGRKVARLLGADWDTLELHEHTTASAPSSVVPLQRPLPPSAHAALMPGKLDEHASQNVVSLPVRSQSVENSFASTNEEQAVPIGLSTPANETLLIHPTAEIYATKSSETPTKYSTWTAVITLVLVTAAGAGAAYAFVEYSPYRLYWPW
jgi:transcriptional regulator with XRE-family HTH domain